MGRGTNHFFLAKDVGGWIQHSNVTKMLQSVDDEQKVKIAPNHSSEAFKNNITYNFLTGDGVLEALIQSRKPVAKTFLKQFRPLLKEFVSKKEDSNNVESEVIQDDYADSCSEKLESFSNSQFGNIRTMTIDGDPWFVGKDVAEVLGYVNPRDALSNHVESDDKNTVAIHDGIRGNPNTTLINESGLYSLIFSSRLPTAKQFKHWVTSEVLPSIRKTGGYQNPNFSDEYSPQLQFLINTEREQKRQAKALEAMNQRFDITDQKLDHFQQVISLDSRS